MKYVFVNWTRWPGMSITRVSMILRCSRGILAHSSLQTLSTDNLGDTWQFQDFSSLHRFSIELRSGELMGATLMYFPFSYSFVTLMACFESVSCWKTHPLPMFISVLAQGRFSSVILCYVALSIGPSMQRRCSIPLAEKQSQCIMFPPP